MPWLFIVLVSIFVLGSGWLHRRVTNTQRSEPTEVIAGINYVDVLASATASSIPTVDNLSQTTQKGNEVIKDTSMKQDKTSSTEKHDNFWIYPNAQILVSNEINIELKSVDDPMVITEWYESKLRQKTNSISISKANANGNINNMLAGNDTSITITKKSSEPGVKISIQWN